MPPACVQICCVISGTRADAGHIPVRKVLLSLALGHGYSDDVDARHTRAATLAMAGRRMAKGQENEFSACPLEWTGRRVAMNVIRWAHVHIPITGPVSCAALLRQRGDTLSVPCEREGVRVGGRPRRHCRHQLILEALALVRRARHHQSLLGRDSEPGLASPGRDFCVP